MQQAQNITPTLKSQSPLTAGAPLLQELVHAAAEQPDLKASLDRDEAGDAELFAALFRGHIVYDHAEARWYIWRGNYWEPDQTGEVCNLVSNRLSAEYLRAAADCREKGDKDGAEMFEKRAHALLHRRRVENVLWYAQKQDGLSIKGDEWDRDPMLLGVSNGVINLMDGTFRGGQPGDFIRTFSPVDWQGLTFPATLWDRHLRDVFGEDVELGAFMRRLFGYSITGKTIERRLPILSGTGANGKSVTLEAIAYVLGPYSHTTQADCLMDTKRDGAGPQPFVYALRGRRLVWATESREGQRMNAGLVKQLTGGDSITTRTMFRDVVTFKPTHKVMLLTNHRPHVSADDIAMWDRLLPVEFTQRFVDHPNGENEHARDAELAIKLQDEAPGILAWLVRGCIEWQEQGLNPPACVLAATAAYREEEDTIGDFISECLTIGPGMTASAKDIYRVYTEWAKAGGADPMSMKALGQRLHRRFGEPIRNRSGKVYSGLGVATAENGTQNYS